MLTLWGILTAVTVGGGLPIVGGLWLFERRRSRNRNRRGECAACGTGWSAAHADEGFLIHGRLVCPTCAERARRRLPLHFGVLGIATAVATGGMLIGGQAVLMALLPTGAAVAMTLGAVQWMKGANRNAQLRISRDAFPDWKALTAGRSEG